MALSKIWAAFILISIVVAGVRYAFVPADQEIFGQMVTGKAGDSLTVVMPAPRGAAASAGTAAPGTAGAAAAASTVKTVVVQKADGLIETCKFAVVLALGLIGIMAFFMGLVTIAEEAGGVRFLARLTGPFFSKLFPDIPKGHPSIGHMVMNFSANLLGLDNAATPFALKAMESLQEINPVPEQASNSQIMFLCLHASGLQVVPVTMIAIRASMHAPDPTDIFIPIVIATFITTVASMLIVAAWQRINIFKPVVLAWVGSLSVLIASLVLYLRSLDVDRMQSFSRALSGGLILLIVLVIIAGAVYKKIDLFSAFVTGAKGGFDIAVRIIPYLVGMLAAISLLRTSGTFDAIIGGIRWVASLFGGDTRWVDGMPTALVKPFTSAGARGMLVDTMKSLGANSFAARLSGTMQGSSETVFYVVAVYFGAVGIRNTRYSIPAMLLAEVVSVVSSIGLAYLFFGNVH
ncbi:MAG TPA: nucleoside recognition domain-containing protein [Puia sp.]|nr:nucleoside recognition domain-containing protein [Puia sp.]